MKIMLSEFIKKLELGSNNNQKVKDTVSSLRTLLVTKGDIEIDLNHMCKILGVEIN
jgi:uncharacterized protein YuzE